jgi:hypothetical protein
VTRAAVRAAAANGCGGEGGCAEGGGGGSVEGGGESGGERD